MLFLSKRKLSFFLCRLDFQTFDCMNSLSSETHSSLSLLSAGLCLRLMFSAQHFTGLYTNLHHSFHVLPFVSREQFPAPLSTTTTYLFTPPSAAHDPHLPVHHHLTIHNDPHLPVHLPAHYHHHLPALPHLIYF